MAPIRDDTLGAAPPSNQLLQNVLHVLLNSSSPPSSSSSISPPPPPPSSSSSSSCSIDESYKYIFLPICYSFTFVFSISLNSVVLYRSFRRTKRWNASLIYMVNLASTDFMYGLSLPFLVASYIMQDRWVFGDFMCRLVRFLFYFNLYCSIFFLTCISVHRYLGICHPMRTITLESKRAVKWTCVLVWGVVFALTSPIFRFAQTGHVTRGGGAAGVGNNATTGGSGVGQMWMNNSYVTSSVSGLSLEQTWTDGDSNDTSEPGAELYQNCWDDAIDKEFSDYVPYGIILHLLGFFVPFTIIAWCYSHVVLTIFRTLRSQPPPRGLRSQGENGGGGRSTAAGRGAPRGGGKGGGGGGGARAPGRSPRTAIYLGARSPYAHRRRKSIRTIITITLLFALCFFPFHVTRTIFLVLKVTRGVPCHTMTMVSMCYKITRPLASFNAWLNALLYFLTKEKGGPPCCHDDGREPQHGGGTLLWPLRTKGKAADEEEGGMDEGVNDKEDKDVNRTLVYIHRGMTKVPYSAE